MKMTLDRNTLAVMTLVFVASVVALFAFALPVEAQSYIQNPDCWEPGEEFQDEVTFGFQTFTVTREGPSRFKQECYFIRDGRENANDNAASGAIYCVDEGVTVWDINHMGEGDLILDASPAELEAVSNVAENTLIKEAGGFRLYRLTTGELQVNAPPIYSTDPEYVFIWDGC